MRRQRERAARVLGLAAFGIALLEAACFVGCVDGTTPDCSDASTRCGPDVDATSEQQEGAALPEASPAADAPNDTSTAAVDAGAATDAGLDGGDGG